MWVLKLKIEFKKILLGILLINLKNRDYDVRLILHSIEAERKENLFFQSMQRNGDRFSYVVLPARFWKPTVTRPFVHKPFLKVQMLYHGIEVNRLHNLKRHRK